MLIEWRSPMAELQESTFSIDPAIIALAQKFEQALAAGEHPHVEFFLKQVASSSRGFLLLDLLRIQLEHEWKRGVPRTWSDYLKAWPELANCVGAEIAFQTWNKEQEELAKKKPDWPKHERYEFLRKLGYGSFGSVYKAWDRHKEQHVAVKVSKATSVAKKTFEDERCAIEKLEHKHIVRLIRSHCPTEPTADRLLVYELMEGGTLKDRLKSGPLAPEIAVEFAIKIADALQHAHDNDLIHRDLKPANILFDLNGELYVGDFGLAVTDAELLHQNDVDAGAGTHLYMSPEQLRKERPTITLHTDIYSLGVILYEMLCGKRPFEYSKRDEFEKFKELVVHRPPVHVWKRGVQRPTNEEFADRLWDICFQALAKIPTSRFSCAKAMAIRLRAPRLSPIEPINAAPASAASELQPSKRIDDPFDDLSAPEFANLRQPQPRDEHEDKPNPSETFHADPASTVQIAPEGQALPPFPTPPRATHSKSILAVLLFAAIVIAVAVWLQGITPDAKNALADEFKTKTIPLHFTASLAEENQRLVWSMLGQNQQPIVTIPPAAEGEGWFTQDLSLLGIPWPPDFKSEVELPWIKLRQQLPNLPIWNFDRCEPSQLHHGDQLLVLKTAVFNQSQGTLPTKDFFAETQLRSNPRPVSDGSDLIELELQEADIALGSPVFVSSPATRLTQLIDEHVHRKQTSPKIRLAGFVTDVRGLEQTGTSVRLKSAIGLAREAPNYPPPKEVTLPPPNWIDSSPDVEAELVTQQTTQVRLRFEGVIHEGSAFRDVNSRNASVVSAKIKEGNSGVVLLEVIPLLDGTSSITLPDDFVRNADNAGSQAVTLKFKAVNRTPPKFLEMKWIATASNDKRRRSFEVTFSKPVKPKEGSPQDWFLIYDGAAADGATVLLDEPWKESRRQLRGDVRVKQEGALILKFRSEFFVDDSGISIAPGDDPDIDVDQRKLRGVFDWTGPKLNFVLSQRIVQLNGTVSVRVVTEPEEQVQFSPSQISVKNAVVSPTRTTEPATSVEFNLQTAGSDDIQITIFKSLAEDASGNSSLEEFSFSIPVRAMPSTQNMTSLIARAEQVFGRLNPNDRNPAVLADAEKLLDDIDKVATSATPTPKSSDGRKAVWEWNCLRGAVALELARYFYALPDGREKFRTHIEIATSKLDQSRVPAPNTAHGKALAGMLAARSRIDRASDKQVTATGAVSETGRMKALGWLTEAETILGQIQNDIAILGPDRRDFISYYDYLVARRRGVSNWVEHNYQDAYLPPNLNPAGKPNIWTELEKSFAENWKPQVVTINKGKQHD